MRLQMVFLMMSLGLLTTQAQDSIVVDTYFNDSYLHDSYLEDTYFEKAMILSFQSGAWMPLGRLRKTFGVNPSMGVWVGFPLKKEIRVAVGFSLNFPIDSKPFGFEGKDTSFLATSRHTLNGTIGFRFTRKQTIIPNVYLDQFVGIGYSWIDTGVRKLKKPKINQWSTQKQDQYDYLDVKTFGLSAGLSLKKRTPNDRMIGCYVEYNFIPYSLSGVKRDFGTSSLVIGLTYQL